MPTRKAVAGDLLEYEFERQRDRVREKLAGRWQTMSVDGWTGPLGQPIIGLCVGTYCLKAFDTSGATHTGEQVRRWTVDAAAQASRDFGVKISSVVGDNASNMVLSRSLLGTSLPEVEMYGCQVPNL
jgi:hypothetical protein